MFDIGWSELLVIVVVAIVVVGPKELPRLLGTLGHYAGKLKRAAADFQRQFDEAMRDTEIAEVKQAMDAVRAETAALDKPVMLPKLDTPPESPGETAAPAAGTPAAASPTQPPTTSAAEPKPKPPRKRTATKPKTSDAGHGKPKPEGGS